jgi:hypothetical protein
MLPVLVESFFACGNDNLLRKDILDEIDSVVDLIICELAEITMN